MTWLASAHNSCGNNVFQTKVPELSGNLIQVTGELGDGKYGKVFKAQILSNLHYCPNDPVRANRKFLKNNVKCKTIQKILVKLTSLEDLPQKVNLLGLSVFFLSVPLKNIRWNVSSCIRIYVYPAFVNPLL